MSLIPYNQVLTTDKVIRSWGPMAAGDTCTPLEPWGHNLLVASLQASGVFGGNVTIEISNDYINWIPLKDLAGTPVVIGSAGMYEISSAARFIRPSPGIGVSAVTITLCMRGAD